MIAKSFAHQDIFGWLQQWSKKGCDKAPLKD
jgi:hypothetical protein